VIKPRTVTALAVAALLAACGGNDDAGSSTGPTASTVAPGTVAPSTVAVTTVPASTEAVGTVRPGGPAPTAIPAGMGSAEADGTFPRTVAHYKGVTTLATAPQRIVVIGTGQLDVVLTLGVVPVGAVARDGADTVQPYLVEAFPELADGLVDVAAVGSNSDVNFEAIAALQPDLIFDNGGAEAETYDQLASIAPTVITAGTGVNWKQDFLLIASALGRSGPAEQFMASYDAAAGELAAAVAGHPPAVSFVRFNTGRARMFGVPSFAGSIAWDAGLDRPSSQQFNKTSQDLSEELIAAVDGDWLFYSVQGDPAGTPFDAFAANPLWANLDVIRNAHVTVVPDDPWYLSAGPTAARIVLDGLAAALAG
jgi:iron complex transport system substrate-binding protein